MRHIPVLLQEVIRYLAPSTGEVILDATVNRGGHAQAIAAHLGPTGTLLGLDLDATAIQAATEALARVPARVLLRVSNYRQLDRVLAELKISTLDGALFDLGLSSEQLDDSGRGFSFLRDEPLAMSFSATTDAGRLTAHEIVNHWRAESLTDIIEGYGEERFARRIAEAIVAAREFGPIESSLQLAEIIRAAVPAWYRHGRIHPATRTFQALRIATNDELGAVAEGLAKAWNALKPGGRLAVITFHSLEARLVKEQFKHWITAGQAELVTKKAIKPSWTEVRTNPRARSAQLRVITKLP